MTRKIQLNLARKYRSKRFNELIGQELPVALLKNGLKLHKFFPVYLFYGLQGSGKTSTGRIFAAAVNCKLLDKFQKDSSIKDFPCLECESCKAMLKGNHPDFIEIDAASHTGVDNVRQIIEAASFLPAIGLKKIYLIDETHMLSKAAFNAFLKILEEPPQRALFILATTQVDKVLPTVRSRSFQLFFEPISVAILVKHLETICKKEKVKFESEALKIIAAESAGSVRDAINLVEMMRLSRETITVAGVNKNLGIIADNKLIELLKVALFGSQKDLLLRISEVGIQNFSPQMLFKRFVLLIQALIRACHGVEYDGYLNFGEEIKSITNEMNSRELATILEFFYRFEPQFTRSSTKHAILEMILCKISELRSQKNLAFNAEMMEEKGRIELEKLKMEKEIPQKNFESADKRWAEFLKEVEKIGNPFVSSIFKQGEFMNFDRSKGLCVSFSKRFEFYKEWLLENKKFWNPALEKVFGIDVNLIPEFSKNNIRDFIATTSEISKNEAKRNKEKILEFDVSDKDKWKKANELLRVFPGKISVIEGNSDG